MGLSHTQSMTKHRSIFSLLFLFLISGSVAAQTVPAMHVHNDEEQAMPLLGAIAAGARRVEVDVWRIGSTPELRTGHSIGDTVAGVTLQSQYLDPLVALNPKPAFLDLVIDAKVVAQFAAVQRQAIYDETIAAVLERPALSGWLRVTFTGSTVSHTIGGRPSWVFFQHWGISSSTLAEPASREPIEAEPWPFTWTGAGAMPPAELAALGSQVAAVHNAGKFYLVSTYQIEASGNMPAVWEQLRAVGVDYVSTDHPADYADWVDSLTPPSDPPDAGPPMCECPCE